ncbi:uncharacterized protein LOC127365787 isoform X9 [Dicentrarchus labrax]|uniref:uncharacterized protein LOC127365787 isoform X9 n=1 Tax=Dicentrarchus labrax TaxID=13489 RepID=UPI0021F5D34A|nr:uncharacterized protein LOC127365787 isoform X9 [Dicentrarchus labrax]
MMFILLCLCLLCLTATTLCDEQGTFVVNVAQTSYQAEENNNITLEWTFKTNNDSSNNSLNIFCELIADQKVSVLYDLHEGVEVPESQHEQFAGRVQCDKDVLTEGKIRLHVSKLRTEDSGLYVCNLRTNDGGGSGRCQLTVTAPIISATVGGSVLIPCSLPVPPLILRWFFWQDQFGNILFHWDLSGQTMPIADKYKKRCQVFPTEFSSGNISIRLDNVTVGDDNKTFWAYVRLMDEKNVPKPSEQRCKFTVQVSAPHQHLVLTVNNTANRATCTAHGGYPEPKVSWTGRKKSSTAQLDLQDAETSLQQDPTEKTFSVTSSVSVKEFQSVTCIIFNPRTNQRIKGTAEISDSGVGQHWDHHLASVLLAIFIVDAILYCVQRKQGAHQQQIEKNMALMAESEADGVADSVTDVDHTVAAADAEVKEGKKLKWR